MGIGPYLSTMRTDSTIPGILIQQTNSDGLITLGLSSGAPSSTATLASKFALGCVLIDTQTGLQYSMNGTVAVPTWTLTAANVFQTGNLPTIATTGNTDLYLIVPRSGVLSSIDFSGVDALSASDSNYITFSVTNLGQAGAGSTAMLAATDANTTKSTGGTALAANTKRSLTVSTTAANLVVVAGDRLRVRAAATGTLGNTVTFPAVLLRYIPATP